MTVLIFVNGKLDRFDWISPLLERAHVVIAADGGANHLERFERVPDVVIGDMDSISPVLRKKYESLGVVLLYHPKDKDETDLELALRFAVEHYSEDIGIVGSMGGRVDQLLGNILLLSNPDFNGRHIEVLEENQRAWLAENFTVIEGQPGDLVSLIPIKGDVMIKSTDGLKWPLENDELVFGETRGISNEMVKSVAQVKVNEGTLLCVHIEKTGLQDYGG